MPFVAGLFTILSSVITGFFGVKKANIETIQSSIKTIADINASEGQREAALASIISSEANSGYWLAACWRPLLMVTFMGFLISFWFGYTPPHLTSPMPPMIQEIFDIIKIGIGGYIPARTLEKIVASATQAGVLKSIINMMNKK